MSNLEILAESFESFIPSNTDKKGRVMGFVVGLREVENTGECYAWVQRSVKTSEGFADFGVPQRSRKFPSLESAKAWAYGEAKERAAKLVA